MIWQEKRVKKRLKKTENKKKGDSGYSTFIDKKGVQRYLEIENKRGGYDFETDCNGYRIFRG